MTDEEADAPSYGAATKTAMHAATPVHAAVDGPATPDGSAAELAELMAAMGIDDTAVAAKTAQVVSSGWSTPVGSPPHNSYGCQWLNNDSCHWGSSGDSSDGGGSATNVGHLSGGTAQVPAPRSRRASREERAAREAARQASNNAFVASRQVIGNMKEEASKAFQMAIDARVRGLGRCQRVTVARGRAEGTRAWPCACPRTAAPHLPAKLACLLADRTCSSIPPFPPRSARAAWLKLPNLSGKPRFGRPRPPRTAKRLRAMPSATTTAPSLLCRTLTCMGWRCLWRWALCEPHWVRAGAWAGLRQGCRAVCASVER